MKYYITLFTVLFLGKIGTAQLEFSTTFEPIFSNNYHYDEADEMHSIQTIDTLKRKISGAVMFKPMLYKEKQIISFDYDYQSQANDSASVTFYTIDTIFKQKIDLGVFPLPLTANHFEISMDSIIGNHSFFGLILNSTTSSMSNQKQLEVSELNVSNLSLLNLRERNNNSNELPFDIAPNPSNGLFKVKSAQKMELRSIYDTQGKPLNINTENKVGVHSISIDLSDQAAGNYIVQLIIDNKSYSAILIKQ